MYHFACALPPSTKRYPLCLFPAIAEVHRTGILMPKKNREPVEPSRIQPARKEKVTEYTDSQLGVDSEREPT